MQGAKGHPSSEEFQPQALYSCTDVQSLSSDYVTVCLSLVSAAMSTSSKVYSWKIYLPTSPIPPPTRVHQFNLLLFYRLISLSSLLCACRTLFSTALHFLIKVYLLNDWTIDLFPTIYSKKVGICYFFRKYRDWLIVFLLDRLCKFFM